MMRTLSLRSFTSLTMAILLLVVGCSSGTTDTTTTPTQPSATTVTVTTTLPSTTTTAAPTTTTEPIGLASPPESVLFVGNSLTYRNGGVDYHFERLAESADPPFTVEIDAITEPGRTLKVHWFFISRDGSISDGGYDAVVLQDYIVATDLATFDEHARLFVEHIRDTGAEPVFFMSWPNPNSGIVTMEEIDQAYSDIVSELDIHVAPVGLAFQRAMNERPEIDVYAPDGAHPSLYGTYLAANVIYATIYGENSKSADYTCQDCFTPSFPNGLAQDEAEFLQRIAWETVEEYQQQH